MGTTLAILINMTLYILFHILLQIDIKCIEFSMEDL